MFKHAVTPTTAPTPAPTMLFAVVAAKVMTPATVAMMMVATFFVIRMTMVTAV
jgi:hypothetical protein